MHEPITTEQVQHAEAALLGSLLLHPEASVTIRSLIQPADFSLDCHRLIFEALLIVAEQHAPDVLLGVRALLTAQELEEIGGLPYLAVLKHDAEGMTTPLAEQAQRIKDSVIHRQPMQHHEALRSRAAGDENLNQTIDDGVEAQWAARQYLVPVRKQATPMQKVREVSPATGNARHQPACCTGIPTGFVDLDMITSGLQRSDLIIVAGPPSVGKTSFALSIALHVLLKANCSVGIFSLEASTQQVIQRLLFMETTLDQERIHAVGMAGKETVPPTEAHTTGSTARLWIDDTANLSTAQLSDKAHAFVEHYGVDLIIVDYVHLLLSSVNDRRHENRVQEIGEISRNLKVLARDLNIPILALAHLSRTYERRGSKTFQLSDLRDGSLENDADLVLFLSVTALEGARGEDFQLATVQIAKHRHGPRADLDICFQPGCARFHDFPTAS
jgi:replicative DNA helicase